VKNQIGTFYSILDTQWVSRVTDVKANTIISNLVPELVLFGLITTKNPNLSSALR
jgi:hypothetical protein